MPPNPLLGCPANTAGGCLNYGSTFSMTDNYGPGNWGWLNIPPGWSGAQGPQTGAGASQLNTNISNGCTCDMKVGDVVATKTGENWGPISAAVNGLITAGSLPGSITGKESQLVTVPTLLRDAVDPDLGKALDRHLRSPVDVPPINDPAT